MVIEGFYFYDKCYFIIVVLQSMVGVFVLFSFICIVNISVFFFKSFFSQYSANWLPTRRSC